MNIPPDNDRNDLNRGPPDASVAGFLQNFLGQIIDANREWTDAKDLAFRFTVPLFSIAAVAMFNRYMESRDCLLREEERSLKLAKAKLEADKKAFQAERSLRLDRPLTNVIRELMAEGNKESYKAIKEINSLEVMIKDILKIKCSPTTSREQREPIEKALRAKIVSKGSPFDSYGNLKGQMLEDTMEILKKDVAHCDFPWPIGRGNNGELYKVYRENWILRVELEKHKHVLEHLKGLFRNA
ncbi:uncharacterized protein [Watersipora subatra]|uniref:uncharacterized protein n=1 Tax=Watersipora subatra TaxID=2589382 RepID=UPI00355C47D4